MTVKKLYIADLHLRLLAGFLDLLILQFLAYVLYKVLDFCAKAGEYEYLTTRNDNWYFGVAFILCFILTVFMYFSIQHAGFSQASVGKRLVGLEVVDKEGQPISRKQANIRALGKVLSYLFFFISGPLIIFSSQARSLGDRMANTFVVIKASKNVEL